MTDETSDTHDTPTTESTAVPPSPPLDDFPSPTATARAVTAREDTLPPSVVASPLAMDPDEPPPPAVASVEPSEEEDGQKGNSGGSSSNGNENDKEDGSGTSDDVGSSLTYVTQYSLLDAAGRQGLYTGPVLPSNEDDKDGQDSTAPPSASTAATTGKLLPHTPPHSLVASAATGTLVYQGHDVLLKYTGPWKMGKWHGPRGRLQTVKGDTFEGPFTDNQMGPGWGRYEWADGRVYTGSFATGGVKDGQGEYAWPSTGAVYKGSFVNNQRQGYGQYTDPSTKITYTGEWEGGLYQGYGQYQYQDKGGETITYRGTFAKGQPHGQGKEVDANGAVRFEGEWARGKPVDPSLPASTPSAPAPVRLIQVVQDQAWVDIHHENAVATYRGLWNTKTQLPCKNGTVEYSKPCEMLRYEGCFNEAGQFHGKGRLLWNNGDVYEGDFELGNRHGKGIYRWSDGRQYTGDFVQNLREGNGRLLYTNSDYYEGGFYQGQRHGTGRFIFANGSMYEGNWAAGKYEGRGTLVHSDGRTYVGEFQDGKYHGRGQEKDPAGNMVYDGEFIKGYRSGEYVVGAEDSEDEKDKKSVDGIPGAPDRKKMADSEPECVAIVDEEVQDCQGNIGRYTGIVLKESRRPHGVGRLVYADGRRIHEGFWQNGSKEGHGRCLFFPQGDFHEGEYQNNLRNGPGRYKWKDGRSFVGTYKDDLRHGKGVFKYPSGDCYDGMFFNGQRSGFGRFQFNGGFYEGEWLAGKYNGKGMLQWANGTQSYEGEFLEGTFHGKGVKKDADGTTVQDGYWKEGHFNGPDEKKEDEMASKPAAAEEMGPTVKNDDDLVAESPSEKQAGEASVDSSSPEPADHNVENTITETTEHLESSLSIAEQ